MLIDKNVTVSGIKLWEQKKRAVKELLPICRRIAAEGSVLLENHDALPFKNGEKVAVFGRIQKTYIKSGTGSGGLVNVEKAPVILESLRENGVFQIDEKLAEIYREWISEHPFDNGSGWASEPWFQEEMPVSSNMACDFAARNDAALVIIGRTAGEDKDNSAVKGSYYLTDIEEDLIKNVSSAFKKTVVVLNVGNPVDLSFSDECKIDALMYIWQGGMEGANALADVLSGKISPSGKMFDTQITDISAHPAEKNFGDEYEAVYEEDIYVGYRYFETFAKDKVRYPFGYGLTYTRFSTNFDAKLADGVIYIKADLKNTGGFRAKNTVLVFASKPCGELGNPSSELIAFDKTRDLAPGEEAELSFKILLSDLASYDDSGVTGFPHAFVLLKGEYVISAGEDVRSAKEILSFRIDKNTPVEQLSEVMTPVKEFSRIVAAEKEGRRVAEYQKVPLASRDLEERIRGKRPKEIEYTGNRGIKLIDVADGRYTMDEFVAQMSDEDMVSLCCAEGMNSPKVTPGTGGAFGGLTQSLRDFGIPIACVSDGPSGLRMSEEYYCTSLPGGNVLAATFDVKLIEELFTLEGVELFGYGIDALLGPGLNIHRHPLCGRNFEYFSEDPLLSGKVAAAVTRGLIKSGVTATIKHFCCNNQEQGRTRCNAVVSERALREIYLKGFEIAVKEGGRTAVMTSYNPVNGYWSASNYDLNTTVLREEWGFEGMVMTDWWAQSNCFGEPARCDNLKAMIRSQNDIFMVGDVDAVMNNNILDGIKEGYITRGELQRSAKNLLFYIMNSPTFMKYADAGCQRITFGEEDTALLPFSSKLESVEANREYRLTCGGERTLLFFEVSSESDFLAQNTVLLQIDGTQNIALSVNGTNGEYKLIKRLVKLPFGEHKFTFSFPECVKVSLKTEYTG